MSSTDQRKRLVAILAADAAGYSRLMAADEAATVAALDAARAVFRTQIESNQGRVIDMAGDSVLSVFDTATGAISAALAIQQELEQLVAAAPEDQRMRFRIGVHLGDVIEKVDGTVYGDGVNIAARLEGLAEPGGITVSESIRTAVKGKVSAGFDDQGEQKVKNIAEAVRAYRVGPESSAAASDTRGSKLPSPVPRPHPKRWLISALSLVLLLSVAALGWLWSRHEASSTSPVGKADLALADSKSLAVLPFTNMSEDKSTAYFADGVHEDLLTQLALLGDLKIVSRTSVMEYRDTKKNARQIAAELGVGSLVEGSVRRAANHVRVSAQLIDARSDKHLWAKSYDRELKDIFAIQSELATEIAKALKVSLAPQEQTRLAKQPTDNLEAYDLFLRHQELVNSSAGSVRTVSSVKDRIALLSKALELDPKFALAWARLAAEHARAYSYGIDQTPARLKQAKEAMERAQALAPEDLLVKIEEGTYYHYALNDQVRAAKAFEGVLTFAPHNVDALFGLADVRLRQMQWGERVSLLERALAIDSRNPNTLIRLSNQYRDFRHFDRALRLLQQLINIRPADHDLKAKFHLTEYWQTGSWDSYDRWRSTLPKGAELESARVRNVDADRAIARRDFNEVLRLTDVDSEDVRSLIDSRDKAFKGVLRALVLRAKGEPSRAVETARMALRLLASELQKTPTDTSLLSDKARLHAILGEHQMAFATLARAMALAKDEGGTRWAEIHQRRSLELHALLGDRKEALAELSRQLKMPESQANDFRVNLSLASLWDDPQFQVIVDDPANNAPLPLEPGRSTAKVK